MTNPLAGHPHRATALTQAKKRQDRKNDHNGAYQINDAVHKLPLLLEMKKFQGPNGLPASIQAIRLAISPRRARAVGMPTNISNKYKKGPAQGRGQVSFEPCLKGGISVTGAVDARLHFRGCHPRGLFGAARTGGGDCYPSQQTDKCSGHLGQGPQAPTFVWLSLSERSMASSRSVNL